MNLKNFGIGKGTSPYKDSEEDARSEKENTVNNANNTENTNTEKNNKEEKENKDEEITRADKPWVKASKVAMNLLKGGIEGVYGDKNNLMGPQAKINYGIKAKESTESVEDKVDKAIGTGDDKDDGDNGNVSIENKNTINDGKGSSYTIQSGDTLSKIAADNNTSVEELMKINPQIKNENMIISGEQLNLGSAKDNENTNENTNINE